MLAAVNGMNDVSNKFYDFFLKIGPDRKQKSPVALACARLNITAIKRLKTLYFDKFEFFCPHFDFFNL